MRGADDRARPGARDGAAGDAADEDVLAARATCEGPGKAAGYHGIRGVQDAQRAGVDPQVEGSLQAEVQGVEEDRRVRRHRACRILLLAAAEELRDLPGRAVGAGEDGHRHGERLDGLGEEDGDPDHRDQLPHAEISGGDPPARHQHDAREDQAHAEHAERRDPAGDVGGADARPRRPGGRALIALRGPAFAADGLEDPQPAHGVARDGSRLGDSRLLVTAAPGDHTGGAGDEQEGQRHAEHHDEPHQGVCPQQVGRGAGDADQCGAARRDLSEEHRGDVGIRRGEREHRAGATARERTAREQGMLRDLDPQVVGLELLCGVHPPRPEAVGEGQHGEQRQQRKDRDQQGDAVPGHDRVVDDEADGDRHDRLAELPGGHQQQSGDHEAQATAHGTPEQGSAGGQERHVAFGTRSDEEVEGARPGSALRRQA